MNGADRNPYFSRAGGAGEGESPGENQSPGTRQGQAAEAGAGGESSPLALVTVTCCTQHWHHPARDLVTPPTPIKGNLAPPTIRPRPTPSPTHLLMSLRVSLS